MDEDVQTQLSNTFEAIPRNINIGCVVEKNPGRDVKKFDFSNETEFPRAKRRDVSKIMW